MGAGALNRGEILRQHDATLEFGGARSVLPERSSVPPCSRTPPVRRGGVFGALDRWQWLGTDSRREPQREFEDAASECRLDAELVLRRLTEHRTLGPRCLHEVFVRIESAVDIRRGAIAARDLRAVLVGIRPVRRITGMRDATIRKGDAHRESRGVESVALDANRDEVPLEDARSSSRAPACRHA